MSSFHRNNEDALREALNRRFAGFEPEAPESLDSILARVKTPKNGYVWHLIKSVALLVLLLQQLPLSLYQTTTPSNPSAALSGNLPTPAAAAPAHEIQTTESNSFADIGGKSPGIKSLQKNQYPAGQQPVKNRLLKRYQLRKKPGPQTRKTTYQRV